jgi:threonine dehydrogenase-like Zn-dependent dehydrogenase
VATVAAVRTMHAGVVEGPRRAALARVPVPTPQDDEVLVRIEGCGVCGSNRPLWEGRSWFDYPLEPGAPGHEGWGIECETGRRVAFLGDAAFAEYAAVPRHDVVPIDVDGPFPGEALACAMNVFARSGVRRGDTVGVVGVGFLGALLVQLAVGAGARVRAFSRRETALEHARAFGAATPPDPEDESCDIAIEAAGVQETLDLASRLCRVRGRLVVAGFHQDGPRQVDMQLWNWRGLDVVNAHERDRALYVEGIRAAAVAVAAGQLDPIPLYTHTFALDRLGAALETARTRPAGFMKALVTTE